MRCASKRPVATSLQLQANDRLRVLGRVAYGTASVVGTVVIYMMLLRVLDSYLVSLMLTLIVALWVLALSGSGPARRR